MSRPRYYWYSIVRKQIVNGGWQNPTTFQEWQIKNAIESAMQETKKLPMGEMRIKAIEAVLITKKETECGFGFNNYYSEIQIRRWINSFVNLVGKKAGY